MVGFFLLVVVVEHVIMISKMLLEMIIDDVPQSTVVGERDRQAIIKKYYCEQSCMNNIKNDIDKAHSMMKKLLYK